MRWIYIENKFKFKIFQIWIFFIKFKWREKKNIAFLWRNFCQKARSNLFKFFLQIAWRFSFNHTKKKSTNNFSRLHASKFINHKCNIFDLSLMMKNVFHTYKFEVTIRTGRMKNSCGFNEKSSLYGSPPFDKFYYRIHFTHWNLWVEYGAEENVRMKSLKHLCLSKSNISTEVRISSSSSLNAQSNLIL